MTIENKGSTPTFVTPADIEAQIVSEHYFTAGDGYAGALSMSEAFNQLPEEDRVIEPPEGLDYVTFCVLILRNRTKIVGVNYGAIDPDRHDEERGKVEARKDAISQVYPLVGYELRTKLAAC